MIWKYKKGTSSWTRSAHTTLLDLQLNKKHTLLHSDELRLSVRIAEKAASFAPYMHNETTNKSNIFIKTTHYFRVIHENYIYLYLAILIDILLPICIVEEIIWLSLVIKNALLFLFCNNEWIRKEIRNQIKRKWKRQREQLTAQSHH